MEVTVLAVENAPQNTVLAVRAGSSLRHVELAANAPFHVPHHGLQDGRVKVSLFEQLGTQALPDVDKSESLCNVPVRCPGGACSQVTLRVRRGQTPSMTNFKTSSIGAEDYMNHHQLEARIHSLFETVLKKQPQDPYRCMIEELQKIKCQGAGGAAPAAAPRSPVAPAEACPKTRPSPAAKGRNFKPSGSSEDALAKLSDAPQVGRQESSSLSAKRQEARTKQAQALSNLETAHEILRMVIRQVVANMASSSTSLGNQRNANRARAIEHAKMVEVSNQYMAIVMRSACSILQAQQ